MKTSKLFVISFILVLLTSMFIGCAKSETEPIASTEPATGTEPTVGTEYPVEVDDSASPVEKSASVPELPPMLQSTADGSFFLEITSPEQSEVIVDTNSITVAGRTTVDAALSVGDTFIDIGLDGSFKKVVHLEDGVNIIEVVASIATGEQFNQVITVIYAQ